MTANDLQGRIRELRAFPARHVTARPIVELLLDARSESGDPAQQALIERELIRVSRRPLLVQVEIDAILDRLGAAFEPGGRAAA